jgi:hypothetical protein
MRKLRQTLRLPLCYVEIENALEVRGDGTIEAGVGVGAIVVVMLIPAVVGFVVAKLRQP